MKTQEEILNKIRNEGDDFFGFKKGDWIDFLNFENAKEFLKDGVTEEEWDKNKKENSEDIIKKEILTYLPFAWDKANDCRGLSAGRSIQHFEAWIWLLGDEKTLEELDGIEYEHYGKEKLIFISEKFGFDWKAIDDGVRTNTDY